MKEKELVLLKHLRENARKSFVKISKEVQIPVSTLFDVLGRLERNVILKHTSLVDFSKLGYSLKVNFIIACEDKHKVKKFLLEHSNVNTLSSLINGSDFFVECIFKDMKEVMNFREDMQYIGIKDIEEIFVVEEIKKEEFGF